MTLPDPDQLFDRELSWIAFNGRVLQEAQDPTVPLFERLAFLSIVSSNLRRVLSGSSRRPQGPPPSRKEES